jgi:hypothetical protein
VSGCSAAAAFELDARPEVSEAPRLEAAGRPRLDDPAVLRTHLVDRARVAVGDRHIEAGAAIAVVLHEAEVRRSVLELGVHGKEVRPHALLVRLEEVNGARTVMAAPPAGNAVGAAGIRIPLDGRKSHAFQYLTGVGGKAMRGAATRALLTLLTVRQDVAR